MTLARRRHLVRTRRTVTGLILVAAISFIAGMTDAVGLLLSGDFVSFMTGNTTRAALYFAEGDYGHAIILFFALWVFVIGNALGIILAHTLSSRRTFVVLTGVAVTIAIAALVPETGYPRVRFYLVILSMGMINATVEHIEGLPIGLTYITGALSRFGRGIGRWIVGDRNPTGWVIQTIPWTGMAAGAVTGAFLTHWLGSNALWVVVLCVAGVAIATVFLPRPLHLHFQQPIVTSRQPRR
ncbi:YoaK family protein [Pseudorhizobium tarimense]|uniref:YoaK family protein n=1 Tax=Pseudorhizobium tarimense TaxID=1079109 RepID=UPI001FF6044C|nr:YoaK family protein [Pseudorhizobium tarimense]MCJ8517719.1 YoaK family protein [Pseudorhizobium tarimense]